MKILIYPILFCSVLSYIYSDPIYKEMLIDNEKRFVWVNVIENKYDANGLLIHKKDSEYEEWWEYDKQGNEIYYKDSNGYKKWKSYDQNGNLIYEKDSKYGYT